MPCCKDQHGVTDPFLYAKYPEPCPLQKLMHLSESLIYVMHFHDNLPDL